MSDFKKSSVISFNEQKEKRQNPFTECSKINEYVQLIDLFDMRSPTFRVIAEDSEYYIQLNKNIETDTYECLVCPTNKNIQNIDEKSIYILNIVKQYINDLFQGTSLQDFTDSYINQYNDFLKYKTCKGTEYLMQLVNERIPAGTNYCYNCPFKQYQFVQVQPIENSNLKVMCILLEDELQLDSDHTLSEFDKNKVNVHKHVNCPRYESMDSVKVKIVDKINS